MIDPAAISPQGSALVQATKTHGEVFAGLPAYVHEAILRAYIGAAVKRRLDEEEMRLYLEPGSTRRPEGVLAPDCPDGR